MEKKQPPKWVKLYSKKVCDFLDLPYENLTIEIVPNPGGNHTWDGAFFIYRTPDGRMQLNTNLSQRPTLRGKQVIIHELIHFKMKDIDVAIRYDIIPIFNCSQSKRKASIIYSKALENFVWEMTEIIYNVIKKQESN